MTLLSDQLQIKHWPGKTGLGILVRLQSCAIQVATCQTRYDMAGAAAVKPMTPLSHQLQIEKLSKELASKDAELASLRNEHSRQEPRLIALRDANRRLERQVSPV